MNKGNKIVRIPSKGKVDLDESIEKVDKTFKELIKKRLAK